MLRIESCNVKTCVNELVGLGNNNMKMWNIFQWLLEHDELQNGTQAEIIKLYVNDELAAYSLLENYQDRTDKTVIYKNISYQELGIIHFITLDQHRNKGYATLLADAMYNDILKPLLDKQLDNIQDKHHIKNQSDRAYFIATGRAVALMERTNLSNMNLIKQFYSDASFEEKVVRYLQQQESIL